MSPDNETLENGILIVTGSNIRAEQTDRPMAYILARDIIEKTAIMGTGARVTVISDLWYLNSEPLKELPTISIGGPKINAASAYLSRRLENLLIIDNTLTIQLDPTYQDLRVSLWGTDTCRTQDAISIFKQKGYLDKFLQATCKWYSHP